MRTSNALILAGAILGAAWILKPAPVVQFSQVEMQRREELDRWLQNTLDKERLTKCAASLGKTLDTLDPNDSAQEASFRKCLHPEDPRGRVRKIWDRIWNLIW